MDKTLKKPPLAIGSYVIPHPSVSVFAIHAIIALVPASICLAAHKPLGAVESLLIGVAFFHARNLAVRWEIARGMHSH